MNNLWKKVRMAALTASTIIAGYAALSTSAFAQQTQDRRAAADTTLSKIERNPDGTIKAVLSKDGKRTVVDSAHVTKVETYINEQGQKVTRTHETAFLKEKDAEQIANQRVLNRDQQQRAEDWNAMQRRLKTEDYAQWLKNEEIYRRNKAAIDSAHNARLYKDVDANGKEIVRIAELEIIHEVVEVEKEAEPVETIRFVYVDRDRPVPIYIEPESNLKFSVGAGYVNHRAIGPGDHGLDHDRMFTENDFYDVYKGPAHGAYVNAAVSWKDMLHLVAEAQIYGGKTIDFDAADFSGDKAIIATTFNSASLFNRLSLQLAFAPNLLKNKSEKLSLRPVIGAGIHHKGGTKLTVDPRYAERGMYDVLSREYMNAAEKAFTTVYGEVGARAGWKIAKNTYVEVGAAYAFNKSAPHLPNTHSAQTLKNTSKGQFQIKGGIRHDLPFQTRGTRHK